MVVNGKGYATAVDLTDDKASGCDADAWAEHLRVSRDSRVKYVICNRRMFSSYPAGGVPAWTWRPYNGSNPHEKHTHLSIKPEAVFDTSPWFHAAKEGILMRDERLIEIPAPDEQGRQLVSVDVNGVALGRFSLHSSVEVCASRDGMRTNIRLEPFPYIDALVFAASDLAGLPLEAGRRARIIMEHR